MPTDYELVKACVSGNQTAFEELLRRYKRLIYSIIYNLVKNRHEVNDISQEVFLRIYKALDRYNPEYRFSTWASKIATNYCMDLFRKKKPEIADVKDIEIYVGNDRSPESIFLEKEKIKGIRVAIDGLPDKYKVPIVLYHQKEMSYREISEIINEPMTIVKNRIYRARKILKDNILADREEGVL